MATGNVLAGIFDRATDDAIALARPVEVKAGVTTYVAPSPPPSGADVFVVLARPHPGRMGEDDVRLTLVGEAQRAPDVFLPSASNIFAVWYGVAGRVTTLKVSSKTLQAPDAQLKLSPGKVVTYRSKLQKRPDIHVSFYGATERARQQAVSLELRSHPEDDLVAARATRLDREEVFAAVDSRAYAVVLLVDGFELRQPVDVSKSANEFLAFELHPVVVSGTVYHGRDPAPSAEVAFQVPRGWTKATADERGVYEKTIWEPGEYIAQVGIHSAGGPPFIDGPLDLRQSQTVDFHVPNTRFVVTVRNAKSGVPVSGAQVLAASVYQREEREGRSAQMATTDENGNAILPPIRQGELVVRARAEGYVDSAPVRHTVAKGDDERSFEIALEPEESGVTLSVLGANGEPAAQADVWAVSGTDGRGRVLWTARTDEEGRLDLPERVRHASFLVRSRDESVAVRRLSGEERATWRLPAVARLTLRAPRRCRVAVWIDGVRVSGSPLSLIAGGMETIDENGVWSAALPAQPLRVLVWRTTAPEAVAAGVLDAAATMLPFPWQRVVELQPVD